MEYLLKKIHMIDILGMLLPGGLLLLMLESDLHILNHLRTALWIEADKLLWLVVFLCLSYFAGMLLHEMGSVIEKILWKNPLLNPRVYVAAATGLMDKYPDRVEEKKLSLRSFSLVALRLLCTLALAVTVVVIALGYRKKLWEEIFTGSFIVFLIALVTQWKCFVDKRFLDKESRERMRAIIRDEGKIQKNSGTNEENARKLGLFSGYYSMLRSILMVLVVLQIFVYLQPIQNVAGTGSWLGALDSTISESRALLFWRYLVVLFIVLRYWHYSCSRFLYVYKGNIQNTFVKSAKVVDKPADRPVFANAKIKEAEAKQTMQITKAILGSMEEVKEKVNKAKEEADKLGAINPNDQTATQLSKLAENALLICGCLEKDIEQGEEDLSAIAYNVKRISEANRTIDLASEAVDKSFEEITKKAVSCLQLEKHARDECKKVIELQKQLPSAKN